MNIQYVELAENTPKFTGAIDLFFSVSGFEKFNFL